MATATPTSIENVLAAFDRAPVGEPLEPEQEAECAARLEDLRSGRVTGVRHDAVHSRIEGMRRDHG